MRQTDVVIQLRWLWTLLAMLTVGVYGCERNDPCAVNLYTDGDGDGYGAGSGELVEQACTIPDGYADNNGDCDDTDPQTYPGAPERCDERDNDCDGEIESPSSDIYESDLRSEETIRSFCEGGCPREIEGDLILTAASQEAIDALGCLRAISGSMALSNNTGITQLVLPALQRIGADLSVDASALERVDLPSLESVGSGISFSRSGALVDVAFPALRTVGGMINAVENDALTRLDFPALASFSEGGGFSLEGNDNLSSISFPEENFDSLDALHIVNNESLTRVTLQEITAFGEVEIHTNPKLETINLEKASTINNFCFIYGNPALTDLDLSSLKTVGTSLVVLDSGMGALNLSSLVAVGGNFDVSEHRNLNSLTLSSLREIGVELAIARNPVLGNLAIPVLESIAGRPNFDQAVLIRENDGLSGIDLSSLTSVGNSVIVSANANLGELNVTALETVEGDIVLSNSALCQSDLEEIGDRVSYTGSFVAENNTGVCD